jgi:cold shock CspA family protein
MTTTTSNLPDTELVTLTVPEGETRVLGQVKWFNNTRGYGFVTATTGDHANTDIFVYQNNLITQNQNIYRTLSKGEYVEFVVSPLENNDQHKFHATAVTGPGAHRLMCETNPQRRRGGRGGVRSATRIQTE